MSTTELIRARTGRIEAAAAVALYGVYELVRGFGGEDWTAARLHTADIVGVERSLGIFWERGIQTASSSVPGLASVLGVLYISLHFVATITFLVWVHRRRPDAFAAVRTTLVVATGLALAGYLTFPAAPPRLAGLGFTDTVTKSAKVNLSSDLLGALYNPIAAVPSLHFGYALLVGAGLAMLATRRWVRIAGALYPVAMLYIIVATGNHFFVDAALGGAVVVAAWFVARALVRGDSPVTPAERSHAYA
jgi:hypothetical protein